MLISLLLAAHHLQAAHHIELYKGSLLPEGTQGPAHYWEVEDTTLDSTQAEMNQGGMSELYGGSGRTILIQFKDLQRALGPNKKITRAQLELAISGGDKPAFTSIATVNQAWNEGPNRTLLSLRAAAPGEVPKPARWSASWRHRREAPDTVSWQKAGALGDADATIVKEASGSATIDNFTIDGLASAVQAQYEHPLEDHGFVLRFTNSVEFLSSNATDGRPKLILDYEEAPKPSGPDLSVTLIERKPEYERMQTAGGFSSANQDGVPVPVLDHPLNPLAKQWPFNGDQVVYTAHVKNVGDAPAAGFSGIWSIREKDSAPVDHAEAIQPGQEVTLTFQSQFRLNKDDHRVDPIAFRITPKGPDAESANNGREIQENALNVAFYLESSFAAKVKQSTGMAPEDWAESLVGLLNDCYFPYSRFSFAPDGVIERIRAQQIQIVPDGTLKGDSLLPDGHENLGFDAEIAFSASQSVPGSSDAVKRILVALGATDLTTMNVGPGGTQIKQASAVSRGMVDRFPGILGGDTRDESALYPTFQEPYEPYFDIVAEEAHLQPTDLLSETTAAQFNLNLGRRAGVAGDALYDVPKVLLSVTNYAGKNLGNQKLSFYQSANGEIDLSKPTFEVTTNASGSVMLPARETGLDPKFTTATGHTLKPNPFGRVDYRGLNGVMLVKAEANGTTEYSWLKLWQAVDASHRSGQPLALMTMRFNLPTDPLDTSTDLAKDRPLTDSSSDASSSLASLADGKYSAPVTLPGKAGSYLEIDLGRDRPVGEVRLWLKSPSFWQRFEIREYGTAEKPTEARVWSREVDLPWSFENRSDRDSAHPGLHSVAYRGRGSRIRFLRIINLSEMDGSATLSGISVTPFKVAAGG